MKPDLILQSDILDILFENRNKAYGAYTLRKQYNSRLIHAMGGTVLLVGLFVVLQGLSFSKEGFKPLSPLDGHEFIEIKIPPASKPIEENKPQPTKKVTSLNATEPLITEEPIERDVSTQKDMDNANLGKKTEIVETPVTGDPGPIVTGGKDPYINPAPPETIIEPNVPLEYAEVMPSFNGDFIKFMLRHLRQPDNIDAGERIVVRAKFVVTAEGYINDVHVVQSGRQDLDEEVLRVVKKMPRWNPGKQSGKFVPVYFNLPVTFVSQAE